MCYAKVNETVFQHESAHTLCRNTPYLRIVPKSLKISRAHVRRSFVIQQRNLLDVQAYVHVQKCHRLLHASSKRWPLHHSGIDRATAAHGRVEALLEAALQRREERKGHLLRMLQKYTETCTARTESCSASSALCVRGESPWNATPT